ncbi:MAG: acetyl-CoA carboxylase carboxyl transferase subunit beta, partial [Verrucomicrobiota bacterium]
MIGFAGARVLKETTRQDLPKGFQTAEFLLERGLVDRIVARTEMRAELGRILGYLRRRTRRNGLTRKTAVVRPPQSELNGAPNANGNGAHRNGTNHAHPQAA